MSKKKLKSWFERTLETGSLEWVAQRITFAVVNFRVPRKLGIPGLLYFLSAIPHRFRVRRTAKLALQEKNANNRSLKLSQVKILYASPVNSSGKPFLEKIIRRFKELDVDYLIFVYDDTEFKEDVFSECKFIYDKGKKWYFMKKYLTPEYCKKYDFIMPWDDDLDILNFNLEHFLGTMHECQLEVAQPALSKDSFYIHWMTIQKKNKIGRLTDAVEIMAQVFRRDAWNRFWEIMENDYNHWGWGYDLLANDLCGFQRTGVIDCEVIRHTRKGKDNVGVLSDFKRYIAKYPKARQARFLTIANLTKENKA